MATRRKQRPAANDTPERPSPGEAAAPRGPRIQEVPAGRMDRLEAANDDAFHAAARRTRRVARLLSWLMVVAIIGIAVAILIAYV